MRLSVKVLSVGVEPDGSVAVVAQYDAQDVGDRKLKIPIDPADTVLVANLIGKSAVLDLAVAAEAVVEEKAAVAQPAPQPALAVPAPVVASP